MRIYNTLTVPFLLISIGGDLVIKHLKFLSGNMMPHITTTTIIILYDVLEMEI